MADGYTPQVAPGGTGIGAPQADGSAFGSEIGGRIADIGDVLEHAQIQHENAAAGLRAADARLAITKGAADLRTSMGADNPGYADAVAKLVDDHRDAVLGPISNKRVQQAQAAQWTDFADQQKGEAYVTQQGAQQVQSYVNIGRQADTSVARMALNPADNAAFGDEIMAADHSVEIMPAPPALKEKARAEIYEKIGVGRFSSWIQSDPVAAKQALETGGYNMYVGAKLPGLLKSADVAIARQDAQAKAQQSQAVTLERKSIAADTATLKLGRGTPEQWDAIAARNAAIGDQAQAVEAKAQGQEIATTEQWRGASPIERQARIDELAAKPQLSAEQGTELKGLKGQQSYLNDKTALFRLNYATGQGVAPIDWSDPDSIKARALQVSAAQQHFGGKPDFLLPQEEQPLKELIASPKVTDRVAAATGILTAGEYAGAVLDQVAPQDTSFRSAIGLAALPDGQALMAKALNAPEAIRSNPNIFNPAKLPNGKNGPSFNTVLDQTIGGAMRWLNPNAMAAIRDNTRSLYASTAATNGWGALHPGEAMRQLNVALGGVETTGGWLGGLGRWNNQQMILPRGMAQPDFDKRVSRSTVADWAASGRNGAPWYPGQNRTMTPRELRSLVPVMVSDGVYRLAQGDGTYITTKDRKPYEFDVRKLHGDAPLIAPAAASAPAYNPLGLR